MRVAPASPLYLNMRTFPGRAELLRRDPLRPGLPFDLPAIPPIPILKGLTQERDRARQTRCDASASDSWPRRIRRPTWMRCPTASSTSEARTRPTVKWTFRGTHTGDIPGFPAKGEAIHLDGVSVLVMDGELVKEERVYWDAATLFGLLEAATSS